jgi:hypothetical protein
VALVVLSVVLVFGAMEAFLRVNYDMNDFYAVYRLRPEIADVGWQREFVRDYGRVRGSNALVNDLNGYVHDPELGWDTRGHFRDATAVPVEKTPDVFRVLAIGDSYTYGAEVNADQTFSASLQRLRPSSQVLNMGVKAYGLDQAVLKYLRYGRPYRADLVVFGVFGPDYVRAPLSFFRFAKPVFKLDANNELVLTGTPIPPPEEVYQKLAAELRPMTYVEALARAAYQLQFDGLDQEAFYNKYDPVIERLFAELLNAAKEDGSHVLILYIPAGNELATEADRNNPCCERGHLTAMWNRLARTTPFDVIDVVDALSREYGADRFKRELVFSHRGRPSGHFTPLGNEAVAKLIDRFIQRRQSGIEATPSTDINQGHR